MTKKAIINRVYKATQNATSHIYRDNDWSAVKSLFEAINDSLPDKWTLTRHESRYEGVIGECGHRKVYPATVCDTENGKDINVLLIASFCGTTADPMGAYDLTLLMN